MAYINKFNSKGVNGIHDLWPESMLKLMFARLLNSQDAMVNQERFYLL